MNWHGLWYPTTYNSVLLSHSNFCWGFKLRGCNFIPLGPKFLCPLLSLKQEKGDLKELLSLLKYRRCTKKQTNEQKKEPRKTRKRQLTIKSNTWRHEKLWNKKGIQILLYAKTLLFLQGFHSKVLHVMASFWREEKPPFYSSMTPCSMN